MVDQVGVTDSFGTQPDPPSFLSTHNHPCNFLMHDTISPMWVSSSRAVYSLSAVPVWEEVRAIRDSGAQPSLLSAMVARIHPMYAHQVPRG